MQTFQEYYNGDNMMNANAVSVKQGGKSIMTGDRKHQNLKRQEYQHKCPHVSNLVNGSASQIKLMGRPLLDTLAAYAVDYKPGVTNTLGNSGVEVQMFEDNEGTPCGMLKKK